MPKISTLIVCDCAGTMEPDAGLLGKACDASRVKRCTMACTRDLDVAARALAGEGTVLIACGQEAERFESLAGEIAEEKGRAADLVTADIRDRAGWCEEGGAGAKQAALLAEAALDSPLSQMFDITSPGTCLVIGRGEAAIEAARSLSQEMAVTCVIASADEAPLEPPAGYDLALGRLRKATGSLGNFTVRLDGYAPFDPAGRGAPRFQPPRDGAVSECDIILDLTGDRPLFPAPHKRDGYLRADPHDPVAVARATQKAAEMKGSFEKPLYISFDALTCAHSRAGQAGCSRCLDICPTGAISPDGDAVSIDPGICAGCGGCAAVCPSGAASYADPPVDFLFRRLTALARTYRDAGGGAPRLLVHDGETGAEMIRLSARYGRGLPPDVIPLLVNEVEGFGHAEMLAALGCGFSHVFLLTTPHTDMSALAPQHELALAIAGSEAVTLISPAEPDRLEEILRAPQEAKAVANPILPMGGRREVVRSAATALRGVTDSPLPLPAGAPYGAVEIDTGACTLCLACVSLCPAAALGDNPGKPQVNFTEAACLQCGICANTCPENAITLTPRLDLSPAALSPRVLHEEEPFACIECGREFGVRSTIERIAEALGGKHWMFREESRLRLVQMCDDCRVRAQHHAENSPFRVGERPRTRTTDDDLAEREEREEG